MAKVLPGAARQGFFDALDGKRPIDAVPLWELEFHLWNRVSGKHVSLGSELDDMTAQEVDYALHRNAEIFVRTATDLGFSAITLPGNYWEYSPGEPAYFIMSMENRLKQVKLVKDLCKNDFALLTGTGGIIAASYDPDFCYKMYDAPEEIDQQCRSMLTTALDTVSRFRDVGLDIAKSSSDMADNAGPFFKPAFFDRFVVPYLQEFAEGCKNLGVRSVLHTDGFLPPDYLNKIADSGVNALQSIDGVAGMDMYKSKEIVGKDLCLCGNIDCGLLLTGTPEEVYDAGRKLLTECKDEVPFVFGASNAIQPEVLVENYMAHINAWRDFAPYTS